MSILLDVVYLIVAVVTAPWWMRKTRGGWKERFGRIEPLPEARRPRIMLHAVSVGEVNLVRRLVDELSTDAEVVVSVSTDTGLARAETLYGGRAPDVFVRRYPIDVSWTVRRFLNATRPAAVGLVELEIWPNFLRACGRRGVPVAVVNGRLSDRSIGGYRRARLFFRRWFGQLAFAAVQDEVYRERFIEMGADPARTWVVGSMKWDTAQVARSAEEVAGAENLAKDMGVDRTRPLIVAGSTAPEEHALLHDAAPEGAQLLCAPRRPEWFDEAAAALPGCVRRSEGRRAEAGCERYLLDTIGELRQAYALADVVVVGRSFGDLFGSDPMEPAALGKPVVIGPAVADFKTVVGTMLKAEAIIQTSRAELGAVLRRLIEDEQERRAIGERARACVEENQGATPRHAALLLDLVRR